MENTSSKNVAVKEVNGVFTQSPHEFTSGPFGTLSANLQSSDDDSEATAAFPVTSSSTVNGTTTSYFEMQVLSVGENGMAAVGLTSIPLEYIMNLNFKLSATLPGWRPNAIGWHSDDGAVYMGKAQKSIDTAVKFGQGDVVGAGMCYENTGDLEYIVFFTLNGSLIWKKKLVVGPVNHQIYGLFGCDRNDTQIVLNKGQYPFMFQDFNRIVNVKFK